MGGHLFVLRGDIRRLACDAWLIPTDGMAHVTDSFWSDDDDLATRLAAVGAWNRATVEKPRKGAGVAWGDSKAIPVSQSDRPEPRPWLAWTTGDEPSRPIAGALDFVRRAAKDSHRFLKGRQKPLLALPVVGTGAGGLYHEAGELLESLMPALRADAESLDVDVALVAFEEPHFAAAQAVRKSGVASVWWPHLAKKAADRASGLGRHASKGELVVFFGAGLSKGANLPSWRELLDELASRAGLSDSLREQLSRTAELDHAQFVARHLRRTGRTEGQEVRELLKTFERYALAHSLLASLPVRELITTNYDTLFEAASEACEQMVTVLPWAPAAKGGRWLLKMHGCVNHPEEIVLTRESYLRYAERNAALSGIVQAMLITRQMLFLGFSLRDENFHRIVDAVRRAVRPQESGQPDPFGCALMVGEDEVFESIWKDEIDWIKVEDGRNVEIFLDRLAFESTSPAYLLDHRFDALLDPPGRALKEALQPLLDARRSPAARSAAWPLVETLLLKLGMS